MSRSFHIIDKKTCNDVNCVNYREGYQTEGPINTAYNIYNGRTSVSGIFPTPGVPGNQFTDYYQFGTATPDAAVFRTSQFNPVVAGTEYSVLVNPADLSKAAVFLFTEFTTTDLNGKTSSWLNNPYIISIEQPNQGTSLPNRSQDNPLPTLTGFMFGSFDKMLTEVFNKSSTSFHVLTNPNEIGLMDANKVQIIWPEGVEWSLSFVGPEDAGGMQSRLYTYTSSPPLLTYITVDSDLNPTSTTAVIVGSGTVKLFSVFDEPQGYVTCRQPYDFTFPPNPPVCFNGATGVTGVTGDIASAKACILSFSYNNYNVPIDSTCLCFPFVRESGATGVVGDRTNGASLVEALNAMFYKSRIASWRAVEDVYYPYFRIIHPDNILSFYILLRKRFFKSNGAPNYCFDELQIYRQGALSEFIKNNPNNGAAIYTTNSADILDGMSWCAHTNLSGCFT